VGACLVGLTGVLPLWVISLKGSIASQGSDSLNYLLSFAVGGLLGDVFLHLLPETFQHMLESGEEDGFFKVGISILVGILSFLVLEKILELSNPETNPELREKGNKKIVGYLNLLANCTDNLLHGLAVGTSFLSSFRLGVTTTAAILLHEIPHEFGDFAILLQAGFERIEAAKAQICTALIGLLGALLALALGSSSWLEHLLLHVLPFTAGGFLNIALVSVVPSLMQEKRPAVAARMLVCVTAGVAAMSALTMV